MQIFAPVLKKQMKDCILSIFWPKEEIYKFIKQHSCPVPVLKKIENWKESNLARAQLIDITFDALDNQPDNGTMHFELMLESLAKWNHFDDYWFNKMQKLSLDDAKSKIALLKEMRENNTEKTRQRIADSKQKAANREARHSSIEEMKAEFYSVSQDSLSAQARGIAFEKFLVKMVRFFELKVTEPFRVRGAQIDGAIQFNHENYVIEAKWHDRALSNEPLLAFCQKQDMNMYGRGIFISVNGITNDCLHLLEKSNVKRTIVMDGEDITLILQEMITLPETLEKKIHAAQTKGLFFVNAVTGKSKIK